MVEIIIAIVSSGAFFAFVQFLIGRYDGKREKIESIDNRLKDIENNLIKNERDTLRTQLILMISMYPGEKAEILELAKHYFLDLKGNWFATPIFNKWLEDNDVGKPEWFKIKGES